MTITLHSFIWVRSRLKCPRLILIPSCHLPIRFGLGFAIRTSRWSSWGFNSMRLNLMSNYSKLIKSPRSSSYTMYNSSSMSARGSMNNYCSIVVYYRAGLDSALRKSNWWCFSDRSRWDIRFACYLNFIFLYCSDRIAISGGKVESVFSINSAFVIVWPHNLSCAVIRWSSEFKAAKSGKSSTLKGILVDPCLKNEQCLVVVESGMQLSP